MRTAFACWLGFILLALAPAACFAAENVSARVVFVGTLRSPLIRPPANEPVPDVAIPRNWGGPRPLRATTTIKAEKGTVFGVLFVAQGDSGKSLLQTLRFVTRFPGKGVTMPGQSAPVPQVSSDIYCDEGGLCNASFEFEQPWELVPGEWVFEVFSGAKRLFSQKFQVITSPEKAVPEAPVADGLISVQL